MALFCVLIGGGIAYKACFTSRKVKNNQELLNASTVVVFGNSV